VERLRLGVRHASTVRPDPSALDARRIQVVEVVAKVLIGAGVPVVTGRFDGTLRVESAGDGPVTILLDSAREFSPLR
jgi:D-Tyr-tRNAtyr deacylase